MESSRIPRLDENNFWYRLSSGDTAIIFVHGVLSSSRTCWLVDQEKESGVASYWPDIIARDKRFLGTSIYMGGYHTAIDSGPFEIPDCVEEFFSAIKRAASGKRAPLEFSKICFVCHSMGGIVVRSLLERHFTEFMEKQVGLVLVASPTFGSQDANSLSWLLDIYNNKQGQQLKYGNWSLEDLDNRFRDLLMKKNIKNLVGVEFYENRFVLHSKWFPIFRRRPVVTKQAQGRYFGAPKQIPDSDHFSICKPTSKDSTVHIYLHDFLLQHGFLPAKTPPKKLRESNKNIVLESNSDVSDNGTNGMKLRPDEMVWLRNIGNYPSVRAHEIPIEVVEVFAKEFSTLTAAIAYSNEVSARRLECNPENCTEKQILVLQEDFPVAPANIKEFWSTILCLAGHKSGRSIAAYLLGPNAPIPAKYGNDLGTKFSVFKDWLSKRT